MVVGGEGADESSVNSSGRQLSQMVACVPVMWTGNRPVRRLRLVGLQYL